MFDYYDTLITPEEVADMLSCGMNTTYKPVSYTHLLVSYVNVFGQ